MQDGFFDSRGPATGWCAQGVGCTGSKRRRGLLPILPHKPALLHASLDD